MVGKLFNDLVTTLDILLDTPTLDLCIHHPSVCVLKGKIRIIAKRPFHFRSLQLKICGSSRIVRGQAAKSTTHKQVFLDQKKDLAQDPDQSTALLQGVNDIDFSIEFPSHVPTTHTLPQNPPPVETEVEHNANLCCLPSGPSRTTATESYINYTLSATLGMSRRDILVNNHVSTSIPFKIQTWQDAIDFRQSEDHSYHGKRRARVEFQFQVPKQLDSRNLEQIQIGIQGSWRTLQDHMRVREIQYFLIEEELQTYAPERMLVVKRCHG